MQVYSVDNKKVDLLTEWHEITLDKAVILYEVCKKHMPTQIKDRYENLIEIGGDREKAEQFLIDWSDDNKDNDFSKFQTMVINALSSELLPANITKESLSVLYFSYLDHIVYGLLNYGCTHQPLAITHFEHKNKVYELPKHRKIFDLDIYFEGIKMAQFSEFSDLLGLIEMSPDGYKFMSTAIAVLCLPDGEDYNEEDIKGISEELTDLPMDIVWDVFFYSDNLWNTSEDDSVICLKSQKEERVARSLIDWDGEEIYWTSPRIVEVFSQYPLLSN